MKIWKQLLWADKLSSLGRIAAGMAHEIKNPLAAIKGLTQSLDCNPHDAEVLKNFKEVVPKEIDRLNNLVEKLAQLGKPPTLGFVQVDINTLIENTLWLFQNRCRKRNIAIIKDLNPLPKIEADPEQLTQVLTNLILNAIQAMPEGGELKLKTQSLDSTRDKNLKLKNNEQIIIEISDTGKGISEEDLKNIFEPFVSSKEDGMGLGLSITYKIIKDHKGKIEVGSEIGKGTRFMITFQS